MTPTLAAVPERQPLRSWRPSAEAVETLQLTHATVEREHEELLPVLEGCIPADLRGTLYRNGPARFERAGHAYRHLFDGDGMVASFRFDGGRCTYRNRFVRTRELEAEERAGRSLFRSFGTNLPGGMRENALRLRFKNTANTSVCLHAGKLLALWEGGLPHELHPETLATRGRHDFSGHLLASASLESALVGRELPFSAHPAVDAVSGELWNFGLRMGMQPRLFLYRIGSDGAFLGTRVLPLDELSFVHDFALTPRWLVFVLSPVAFDVTSMALGTKSPVEALRRPADGGHRGESSRPMEVLLVERASMDQRHLSFVRIPLAGAAPGFVFHLPNAFEEEDRVLVDAVVWPRFPRLPAPGASTRQPSRSDDEPRGTPRLVRITIDPRRREGSLVRPSSCSLELASIAGEQRGKRHRYVWGIGAGAGASDFTSLVRIDRRTGDEAMHTPEGLAPSELVVLPASPGARDETDRLLSFTTYDPAARRTELRMVRASDWSPVFRARLPHVLPPGFHGIFVPDPAR